MADYEFSAPQRLGDNMPIDGSYTLTLSAAERELLQMALGELLQTVSRDEHLIPQIHRLLERVNKLPSVD